MVITNPTHYAVALRYTRGEGGAPVVVAKGVDHLALRIREIATEHAVPLIENRPLARSLYDQVDIDEQIPPEFYRAVAEIIHYLNSRGRLPRRARSS
jgi:flagellar biosynthetic protein FlhB